MADLAKAAVSHKPTFASGSFAAVNIGEWTFATGQKQTFEDGHQNMNVPDDVVKWVEHNFSAGDVMLALSMLEAAVIHTGEPASPRLIRCAAVGSRGQIERLALFIKELRVDWRDVIMGGEYEMRDGKLVQVHNFERPIDA